MLKNDLIDFFTWLAKECEYIQPDEKIREATIDRYLTQEKVLTVKWLMDRYPNLTITEATAYLKFCNEHTIHYIECYGEGQIMLPLWEKHKEKFDLRF